MATIYIDGVKAKRMAIGTTEIANILKGTSDPSSSIGGDGQLYLKYGGPDTRYTYSETLGGYVLNDYFYSEANQLIGVVGSRTYAKISSGAAIAVMWKNSTYSGPLLISTVESNITYSYNTSGSLGSATIDGITWYLSTTSYWSNPVENAVAPIIEADYYPTADSRLQEAIETILEASDFKTSLPTNVVNDSFAKVDGVWQNLIGTDIDAIQAGESPRFYTNSKYYIDQEQITDVSGFTKLYSTDGNIEYGSRGEKVSAALDLTDESTITSNMNIGWQALSSCYYDSENHVGAYGGYNFGEELFITKTKFWLGRYSGQNKTLPVTIQYLDSNGDWHDVTTVSVTTDLPYPLNIFEVNINNYVYGVRWIHKTENKTSGNNICFFGMTLYEGSGEYIDVYAPTSGLNEIPEGYDGFGPILV